MLEEATTNATTIVAKYSEQRDRLKAIPSESLQNKLCKQAIFTTVYC